MNRLIFFLPLRNNLASPLPHLHDPLAIPFEAPPQLTLLLLPLLAVLEPVKVVLDAILLLAFLELVALLLGLLEACRRSGAPAAASDGDEAVFVGNGARCGEELVAQCLYLVELDEVVCRGTVEGGGRWVLEGEV